MPFYIRGMGSVGTKTALHEADLNERCGACEPHLLSLDYPDAYTASH